MFDRIKIFGHWAKELSQFNCRQPMDVFPSKRSQMSPVDIGCPRICESGLILMLIKIWLYRILNP